MRSREAVEVELDAAMEDVEFHFYSECQCEFCERVRRLEGELNDVDRGRK